MIESWYNTRQHPYTWDYEGQRKYDFLDNLDILNPPPDLLLSMSTEELAEFIQEYPLMEQIITYFNIDETQNYDIYFRFLEMFSDAFYELLRREDGITCLLKEYRAHKLNVQMINEWEPEVWSPVGLRKMWYAELIGCQFIRCYAHQFTEYEFEMVSQIIEEKKNSIRN